jgi:prepilin-type N-terminal cleavage/methylation domain-containing protein/prepilin-type processing-associated H-X9-DG protein
MLFVEGRLVKPFSPKTGFTLVELLVVIAIIGTLVGLLLPAVQAAREAARTSTCSNNLKTIGLAMHSYVTAQQKLPPGSNILGAGFAVNDYGHNCLVFILPYMEEQSLYNSFDLSKKYDDVANRDKTLSAAVATFLCPSSQQRKSLSDDLSLGTTARANTTHYVGIMGPYDAGSLYTVDKTSTAFGSIAKQGTLLRGEQIGFKQVTDGLSKTLLVGEMSWSNANVYRGWSRGCNKSGSGTDNMACAGVKNIRYGLKSADYDSATYFNNVSFGSEHPGGTQFVFCDGAVRLFADTTPLDVLQKLASRNGGEVTGVD